MTAGHKVGYQSGRGLAHSAIHQTTTGSYGQWYWTTAGAAPIRVVETRSITGGSGDRHVTNASTGRLDDGESVERHRFTGRFGRDGKSAKLYLRYQYWENPVEGWRVKTSEHIATASGNTKETYFFAINAIGVLARGFQVAVRAGTTCTGWG